MKALIILLVLTLVSLSSVRANVIVDLELPFGYSAIKPGEKLQANLVVYRTGGDYGRNDFFLKVYIIDEKGDKISEITKEMALEKEINTIINFNLPQDIKPGRYRVEAVFDGKTSGSDFVVVKNGEKKKEGFPNILVYIILLVLLIFIIFIFFYYRKIRKEIKDKQAVGIEDLLNRKVNKDKRTVDIEDLLK